MFLLVICLDRLLPTQQEEAQHELMSPPCVFSKQTLHSLRPVKSSLNLVLAKRFTIQYTLFGILVKYLYLYLADKAKPDFF